jgi:6-phosphogluconolactonase
MRAFAEREALFDACAAAIAEALNAAIAARGHAGLIVTGGSTPAPVYERLAKSAVDWRMVSLTLSDDRWVSPADDDSNERLVRERLLVGLADQASFVPLRSKAPDLDAGVEAAERTVGGLFPVDVTLLGMGEDGHIASLFPGDLHLAEADDPQLVIGVPQAGLAPFVPRISLSLNALRQSRQTILLVTGAAKRALLERIQAEADYAPPVAALMRGSRVAPEVYWAP